MGSVAAPQPVAAERRPIDWAAEIARWKRRPPIDWAAVNDRVKRIGEAALLFEDDDVVRGFWLWESELDYDEACKIVRGEIDATPEEVRYAEAVKSAAEWTWQADRLKANQPKAVSSPTRSVPVHVVMWLPSRRHIARPRPRGHRARRTTRSSSSSGDSSGPSSDSDGDQPLGRELHTARRRAAR